MDLIYTLLATNAVLVLLLIGNAKRASFYRGKYESLKSETADHQDTLRRELKFHRHVTHLEAARSSASEMD